MPTEHPPERHVKGEWKTVSADGVPYAGGYTCSCGVIGCQQPTVPEHPPTPELPQEIREQLRQLAERATHPKGCGAGVANAVEVAYRLGLSASTAAALEGLASAKYLNPECASSGCQWLNRDQQAESDKNWLRSQRDVAESDVSTLRAEVARLKDIISAGQAANWKPIENCQSDEPAQADDEA